MSWGKSTVTLLAAVAAMLVAQAAIAEESGTYRSVRSYHHEYVTIDHGAESFTGGFLRGTETIVESSGGTFAIGSNRRVDCLVYSRSSDGGIELEAPCTSADADGDSFFTVSIRRQGDVAVGGGGAGQWELLGGTGKYEGIAGSCSYVTEYLEGARVVVIGDCSWSRS